MVAAAAAAEGLVWRPLVVCITRWRVAVARVSKTA